MGARGRNFYNDLAVRFGYPDAAARIQDLYLAGKKQEAEAAVPDDLLAKTSLIGSEGYVLDRLRALAESGVTTRLGPPGGPGPRRQAASIEQVRGLIDRL